eukprot:CAMPEP_0206230172 /NCGR_PEP_ID=MMETSP0047_2-20121206/10100_1 /ASSEMBLY_ACC=CAM_ASM_000192 /TAXON_ID=195065 /ORGANISM="Chroomonas mesostigmatica_cf, Strain CCMP1168" /LENGTH=370 /DNA_ID=CAMNT_0053653543 /DNA_START=210 /DNA_END=1319 /DNA_ORIENTATION=-
MEQGDQPDLILGDLCELHSLSKQEYNGRRGRIVGDIKDGRFPVTIFDPDATITAKPCNLTRVSPRYTDEYASLLADPEIVVMRRALRLPKELRNMKLCASLFLTETPTGEYTVPMIPGGLHGPSQNEVEVAPEGGAVRRFGLAAVLWAEGMRRKDTSMLRRGYELDDLICFNPMELAAILQEHEGDTDDADVLLLRAAVLFATGSHAQALQAATASAELRPTSVAVSMSHDIESLISKMGGGCIPRSAVKGCRRAVKMDPGNENAWLLLLRVEAAEHECRTPMDSLGYQRRLELCERANAIWKKDSSRRLIVLSSLILALAAKDGSGRAERGRIAEVWADVEAYQAGEMKIWGSRPKEHADYEAIEVVAG